MKLHTQHTQVIQMLGDISLLCNVLGAHVYLRPNHYGGNCVKFT